MNRVEVAAYGDAWSRKHRILRTPEAVENRFLAAGVALIGTRRRLSRIVVRG